MLTHARLKHYIFMYLSCEDNVSRNIYYRKNLHSFFDEVVVLTLVKHLNIFSHNELYNDLYQEAMLKVLTKVLDYYHYKTIDNLVAYTFAVVTNRVIDQLRALNRYEDFRSEADKIVKSCSLYEGNNKEDYDLYD